VLKVFGSNARFERTLKALHQMKAEDPTVACLCQDDLIKERLSALGFHCSSFHEELDENMEAQAWEWAWEIRERLFGLLSRASFRVDGYNCTECILGGDADQFAFLASTVLLKEKLIEKGFRTVILVPSEKYLSTLPDRSSSRYKVSADRNLLETLRHVRNALAPHMFPILAVLRRNLSREYRSYTLPVDATRTTPAPRVLIVVTDGFAFPSYYSRPAAVIARACVESGHQVVIVANRLASPNPFISAGFVGEESRAPFHWRPLSITRQLALLRNYASTLQDEASVAKEAESLILNLLGEKLTSRALRTADDVLFLDSVFEWFKPEVLVSMPDGLQLGVSAIIVSRKKNIPSLTALAGQIFDHAQYGHLLADMVAVNSEKAKAVFEKRGVPSERIVVTGMAHFDETFNLAHSARKAKSSTRKLVIFATENLPLNETFEMINSVAQFVLTAPDTRMLIRPHPRENPANYDEYVRKLGTDRILLDSSTSLVKLLGIADVCVTGFSNVAVEAMIMGLPVVCMNLEGKPSKLEYVELGAAIGVQDSKDAASALRKALYDEETKAALAKGRDAFLNSNFYRADGKASLRIASLIEKLAIKRNDRLG
jgi:glycosyltransferase involved in cell wall biosynthesis